jgi:O-antigen ligase
MKPVERTHTLLAFAAGCLPFCNVLRFAPNPSFWVEWLAAAIMGLWLVVGWIAKPDGGSTRLPRASLAFPLLAMLLALQVGLGMVRQPSGLLLSYGVLALAFFVSMLGATMVKASCWRAILIAWSWGNVVALLANAVGIVLGWFGYEIVGIAFAYTPVHDTAIGLMGQPNQLATLAALTIASLMYLRHEGRIRPWLAHALIVLATAVVATSGSRTGIIVVIGVAGLGFWINRSFAVDGARKISIGLPLVSLVVCELTWALLQPHVFPAASMASRAGAAGRFELWRDALMLFSAHPWLGVGHGNFAAARLFELDSTLRAPHADNAHNLFLHMAAEYGAMGLLLALWAVFWLLKSARAATREGGQGSGARFLAVAWVAGIFMHAQFEYPLWSTLFLLPFSLLAGAIAAEGQGTIDARIGKRKHVLVRLSVVALGMVLLVLVAWDYRRSEVVATAMNNQARLNPQQPIKVPTRELAATASLTLFPAHATLLFARTLEMDPVLAEDKLAIAKRAMETIPNEETVARYLALSVMAGRQQAGLKLLWDLQVRNADLHERTMKMLDAHAEQNEALALFVSEYRKGAAR